MGTKIKIPHFWKSFFIFLAVWLIIKLFFAGAYNIPSKSMEPTLLQGDFILTNKLVYEISDPYRGDIVVFDFPYQQLFGPHLFKITYIKRVIGLPGDVIEFHNGFLTINGKPLKYKKVRETDKWIIYEESVPSRLGLRKHLVKFYKTPLLESSRWGVYAKVIPEGACLKRSELYPEVCQVIKVPKGYYFVMGDNRDNSEDSRFWGFLRRDLILSTPFVIYFSGEVPSLTPQESTPFSGITQFIHAVLHPRFDRIGKPLIY